jgi:multifunctional methyltransferase subunit TRM112
MKLLSHNFLRNNTTSAGFSGGYPLQITATEITVTENEYNSDFVKHIIPSLDWSVLVSAASQLGLTTLPSTLTPELVQSDEFLVALHNILVNVHVISGVLTCPTTQREFKIKDGVADFMLEEEECVNVKI